MALINSHYVLRVFLIFGNRTRDVHRSSDPHQGVKAGCRFAIDSDAHAPGQLAWLPNGCERAFLCGVAAESVINTWGADELLRWTGSHEVAS